jgi:hypothetical protein
MGEKGLSRCTSCRALILTRALIASARTAGEATQRAWEAARNGDAVRLTSDLLDALNDGCALALVHRGLVDTVWDRVLGSIAAGMEAGSAVRRLDELLELLEAWASFLSALEGCPRQLPAPAPVVALPRAVPEMLRVTEGRLEHARRLRAWLSAPPAPVDPEKLRAGIEQARAGKARPLAELLSGRGG